MRIPTKKILISGLTLAAGMYAASGNAATLKAGSLYADSEDDLEMAVSLAVEKDQHATAEMMVEGKLLGPTEEDKTVTIAAYPTDHAIYGFRIRGSTTIYWAVKEFFAK
jgi:hypothetical protein